MKLHCLHLFAVCLFLVATVCGCGSGTTEVTGTVTLDGKPLPSGNVTFHSIGGGEQAAKPATATITDGKFTVETTPGKKRVEILAYRETGEKDPLGGAEREQYIHPGYNTNSQLEIEVSEAPIEIKLSSQGPAAN